MTSFDLHFNLASGMNETIWWRATGGVRLASGADMRVLDPTALLFLLVARTYAEIMDHDARALRAIVDIAACLSSFRHVIDRKRFSWLINRYQLHTSAASIGLALDSLSPGLIDAGWMSKSTKPFDDAFVAKLMNNSRQLYSRK